MASYRLIDELPGAKTTRAPWPPLGIFFLTWLFLPLAAPFWILNWGRLGQPEKRKIALAAALVAIALPIGIVAGGMNIEIGRNANTLAKFAFGYFQLFGQRPLYQAHLARNGEKAPVWPLYLAAIVSAALLFWN